MALEWTSRVWHLAEAHLQSGTRRVSAPTLKLVLLVIAEHADPSGLCWPSKWRVARMTCLDERSVRAALSELVRLDLLKIRAYGKGGRGRATQYVISHKVAELSTWQSGINKETSNPGDSSGFEPIPGATALLSTSRDRQTRAIAPGLDVTETTNPGDSSDKPGARAPLTVIEPRIKGPSSEPTAPGDTPGPPGGALGGRSRDLVPEGNPTPGPPPASDAVLKRRSAKAALRGERKSRSSGILGDLIAVLSMSGPHNGELPSPEMVMHRYSMMDEAQRRKFATFALVMQREKMPARSLHVCLALAIERQIENPFAYFAEGTEIRRAIDSGAYSIGGR